MMIIIIIDIPTFESLVSSVLDTLRFQRRVCCSMSERFMERFILGRTFERVQIAVVVVTNHISRYLVDIARDKRNLWRSVREIDTEQDKIAGYVFAICDIRVDVLLLSRSRKFIFDFILPKYSICEEGVRGSQTLLSEVMMKVG